MHSINCTQSLHCFAISFAYELPIKGILKAQIKDDNSQFIERSSIADKTLSIKKKIAITSDKAGTTRNLILGVYNDDDSQIVFVDTPGIHKPEHKLGNVLNKKAYLMTSDVDLVLFVVDISKGFGKGDNFILDRLKQEEANLFEAKEYLDKRGEEIQGIHKIAAVVKDTTEKMKTDLANQGEMLDNIEEKINVVSDNVQEAGKEINKANEYSKGNNKRLSCIVGIVVIAVGVVLAIVLSVVLK